MGVLKKVLAIDFGASNGRVILGTYQNHNLIIEEVHRFENNAIFHEHGLYWDYDKLCEEMVIGIKKAVSVHEIDSVAINTWGVDYGLLDKEGRLISNPHHYRDRRTNGIVEEIERSFPELDLFLESGLQTQEINSLVQLYVDQQENQLDAVDTLLFMPNLFNYYLTGVKQSELTIASTSQLIDPYTKQWNYQLMKHMSIPTDIFPELSLPGTEVGIIKDEILKEDIKVINVCAHDTASAVVSVPSNDDFLFISSGTWSIVGTELEKPVIHQVAKEKGLTNEIGINKTTRLLKNITGLWILQEVKRELESKGKEYTYPELERLAKKARSFECIINPDDPIFSYTGNMIDRIQSYAIKTNQVVPSTTGEIVKTIYQSLALAYKSAIDEIESVTEKHYPVINIVGGGSKSSLLCQMIADATGREVLAGPHEATAMGNIMIQMQYHGVITSLEDIRCEIKSRDDVVRYLPEDNHNWNQAYNKYLNI